MSVIRMPHRFGLRSKRALETCHQSLQDVAQAALQLSPVDFAIIEGHRSIARQQSLYKKGASKLDGINRPSKHNHTPSLALDFVPYPIDWQDHERFMLVAGVFFACAHARGIKIRWGGDWDGDGDLQDQSFRDLPHIELVGEPAELLAA